MTPDERIAKAAKEYVAAHRGKGTHQADCIECAFLAAGRAFYAVGREIGREEQAESDGNRIERLLNDSARSGVIDRIDLFVILGIIRAAAKPDAGGGT